MKKCLINNDISSFGLQMYTQYGVPVIEAMATKGTYCSLIRQCGKAKTSIIKVVNIRSPGGSK